MTYTVNPQGGIVRDADGAHIPADPANSDYAAYLAWVAEGNTAAPYVAPIPSAQVLADAIDSLVADIYSNWTRFQQEYLERQNAATVYKAAGYTGDASIWISAFATAAGLSLQDATDRILAQADSLNGALQQLGALRMRKYEVLGAADPAAAQAAYDDIVSKINTIAAGLQ